MVLEDDDARKSCVSFQIVDPRPPRPQHAPQSIGVERVQRLIVNRRFDNHLVRAEAVARFEQAVRAHVGAALDLQHRIAIGHHAHRPSRQVRGTALAPRQDLRTGMRFATFAERTLRGRILEPRRLEIEVVSAAERSEIDRDRAAGDRIGSELSRDHVCAFCASVAYHPGSKGVLVDGDPGRRGRQVDGDHVKAARGVRRTAIRRVILAHRNDLSLFLRRHFVDGIAETAIGLRLHLHKYYRARIVWRRYRSPRSGCGNSLRRWHIRASPARRTPSIHLRLQAVAVRWSCGEISNRCSRESRGSVTARLDCRAWPPLGTRETTSHSPDCAASLRRTIPISALPEAESCVQSVLLDAVSMAA